MKINPNTLIVVAILIPNIAFGVGVPTTDPLGVFQTVSEKMQTVENTMQSLTQVEQYQKTMAAIGTIKESVTGKMAQVKEVVAEKKKKFDEYKKQVDTYKQKAQAFKADVESQYNEVKQAVDDAKDKYNEVKDIVNEARDSINEGIDMAKSAGDIASSAVQMAQNKVNNTVNSVKEDVGLPSNNSSQKLQEIPDNTPQRSVINTNDVAETSNPTPSYAPMNNTANSAKEKMDVPSTQNASPAAPDNSAQHTNTANNDLEITSTNVSTPEPVSKPITQDSLMEIDTDDQSAPLDINDSTMPTRKTFETSSGYGHVSNSEPLAFASMFDIKTGQTPNKILVVPEPLSLLCKLDYEKAAETNALENCIKKLNTLRNQPDNTQGLTSSEYLTLDFGNANAEYLAGLYIDALNIYNDTVTFKNNKTDAVREQNDTDIRLNWQRIIEMNRALGSRLNVLKRLASQELLIKVFQRQMDSNIKNEEDDS